MKDQIGHRECKPHLVVLSNEILLGNIVLQLCLPFAMESWQTFYYDFLSRFFKNHCLKFETNCIILQRLVDLWFFVKPTGTFLIKKVVLKTL